MSAKCWEMNDGYIYIYLLNLRSKNVMNPQYVLQVLKTSSKYEQKAIKLHAVISVIQVRFLCVSAERVTQSILPAKVVAFVLHAQIDFNPKSSFVSLSAKFRKKILIFGPLHFVFQINDGFCHCQNVAVIDWMNLIVKNE